MSTRAAILLSSLLALVASAYAKPAVKGDPVAAGFVDWQGVTPKGCLMGREICASDLRHKTTIFVVLESNEKLHDQLLLVGRLVGKTSVAVGESVTDDWRPSRNRISLVACRGNVNAKNFAEAMVLTPQDPKDTPAIGIYFKGLGCSVYGDVTFAGAPDPTGKCPYAYVMGPTGTEPLWHGTLTADSMKDVTAAIAKSDKEIAGWTEDWKPFFGNIGEPKFHPQLAKALEKAKAGKPVAMDPVAKSILADVKAGDPEKAREAQVLFDAINQTRSDLVQYVALMTPVRPYLAAVGAAELLKYWPAMKKPVEKAMASVRGNPEMDALTKSYVRLSVWSAPDYKCKNASEAKKILQELNKMKKAASKAKESKSMVLQNVASVVDVKIDELISTFSAMAEMK